jgi:hypothetical protein
MKTEEHIKAYEQHRDAIEWAINRRVERSQRIIGTHASRKIVELLSAYLHSINKIDAGFQINHRWFKSEKVADRFQNFPKKNVIIGKMVDLENLSESLTYETQKTVKEIKYVICGKPRRKAAGRVLCIHNTLSN